MASFPLRMTAGRDDAVPDNKSLAQQPSATRLPATTVPSTSEQQMLERFLAECVLITPGKSPYPESFGYGSDTPAANEHARRQVEMHRAFRICRYETTQELFNAVMGSNPSRWKGPRNSAENMTIEQAVEFCQKLTTRLQKIGLLKPTEVVRLPTPEEWEYCCRAGSVTRFCFGDAPGASEEDSSVLDQHAWHTGNAAGNDPAVGVLKPNAWNLYDMHGYLWEFTAPVSPTQASGPCEIRGG
ncbi:MAG: SUMF1/EgtB/PvdO family nonheme iron enzyme, partial [Planctomycetaceae bacterium]|nr:SUMF1/EgtB/PvdO family nonheme iron enzyme [Planctomycetaceae bacterium]